MRGLRALVVASAFVALGTSVAAAAERPTMSLAQTTVAPGSAVLVTGSGWQPETIVELSVCGNLALDGSADCALASALDIGTRGDGHFSTLFTVQVPPSPCPCVVRVNDLSSSVTVQTVIAIPGAPAAAPTTKVGPVDAARAVRISDTHLDGHRPWTVWFGAGFERTLVATVTNVTATPIDSLHLAVRVGRGDDPTGVVEAPRLGPLAAGESRTIRVPVRLGALSVGDYRVRMKVAGVGQPATASVQTSTYPWGLVVALLVVVQLVLLAIRNRVRRRLHAHDDDPPDTAIDLRDDTADIDEIEARLRHTRDAIDALLAGIEQARTVSER